MTENIIVIMNSPIKEVSSFVSPAMLQTVIIGFLTIFIAVAINFFHLSKLQSRIFNDILQPYPLIITSIVMLVLLSITVTPMVFCFPLLMILLILGTYRLIKSYKYLAITTHEATINFLKKDVNFNKKKERWELYWESVNKEEFYTDILELYIKNISKYIKNQKYPEGFSLIQVYSNNIEHINFQYNYQIFEDLLNWYRVTKLESYACKEKGTVIERLHSNYIIKRLVINIFQKGVKNKDDLWLFIDKFWKHLVVINNDTSITTKDKNDYLDHILKIFFDYVFSSENILNKKIEKGDLPGNMPISIKNYKEPLYLWMFEKIIYNLYKLWLTNLVYDSNENNYHLTKHTFEEWHGFFLLDFDMDIIVKYVVLFLVWEHPKIRSFNLGHFSAIRVFVEFGEEEKKNEEKRKQERKKNAWELILFHSKNSYLARTEIAEILSNSGEFEENIKLLQFIDQLKKKLKRKKV